VSLFAAEQRIGKISMTFSVLAILIALSLWLMKHWLQDFAYRGSLSAWIFVGAGLAGLPIAAATVAGQALRAARTNPAETLRAE